MTSSLWEEEIVIPGNMMQGRKFGRDIMLFGRLLKAFLESINHYRQVEFCQEISNEFEHAHQIE